MPRLIQSNHDAKRFGAVLRRLRVARGLTIVGAARRAGMNSNYLGALEKGGNMPSLDTLLEIAEIYGTSAADIVREVEEARRADRERQGAQAVKALNEPES